MKAALLQMVSSANVQDNLDTVASLLSQAAHQQAELAVLPEYFCLMGHKDTDKLHIAEAFGDGPIQTRLSALAAQHALYRQLGEALAEAAVRVVREEAGIVAEEEPLLHGMFLNDRQFRGDHVACFVLRRFSERPVSAGFEIAEARFFPSAALPEGTTSGTRRRLAEVLEGRPPSRAW